MFGARDTVIKDEGTKNILMAAMNDDGVLKEERKRKYILGSLVVVQQRYTKRNSALNI